MDTDRIVSHIEDYHEDAGFTFETIISIIGTMAELQMVGDSPFIAGPVYDDMLASTLASLVLATYKTASANDIDLDEYISERMEEIEDIEHHDTEAIEQAIEELDLDAVIDEIYGDGGLDDSPTFQ